MSRTDLWRPTRWLTRVRSGRTARVIAVSLGLGVGTAFAADAVRLSVPEAAITDAAVYDDLATSQWRVFDPGFIVDHLPFRLSIGQTISYSDNVNNTAPSLDALVNGNGITRLRSRGDFYSDTTISGASRFPMGAQTFFFNGTYAPRRYFTNTQLDADNYSINGGVDFNIAARCTGRLVGGTSSSQTSLEETAGLGVQTSTATSFNETARCPITGNVAGLFNSGVSRIENTGDAGLGGVVLPFALNDYTQYYVGGGLSYALSGLDTLTGLATFTHRDFTNRPAGFGLAPSTDQTDLSFSYSRTLSAKLDASASGGVSIFSFGLSSADLVEPVYSFAINYRPTPKIAASFTESRSSGAPQSAISDVTTNDSQAISLNYRASPKINVSGVLSHNESRNPLASGTNLTTALPLVYTNYNSNSASVVLNYIASPLVSATASYTYTERTDTSRSGFNAVSNVFRVGLFYTR